MLQGRVVEEACFSTNKFDEDTYSLCPFGATQSIGKGAAKYCPLSIQHCDHGMHVASIATISGYFFGYNSARDNKGKPIGSAGIYLMDMENVFGGRPLCQVNNSAVRVNAANTLKASIAFDAALGRERLVFFLNNKEVCGTADRHYLTGSVMLATSFNPASYHNPKITKKFSVSSVTIESPGFKPPPMTADAAGARDPAAPAAAEHIVHPVVGPATASPAQ
jgi:hypothetical protein